MVLLIAGGLVVIDGAVAARPAHAVFLVADSLAEAWDGCAAVFARPDGDPAGIIDALEGADVRVEIFRPLPGDRSYHASADPFTHFVRWDPDTTYLFYGGGGGSDPCSTLYHELYHAYDSYQRTIDYSECVSADGPTGILVKEVAAVRAQNMLRRVIRQPVRTHYGKRPLPVGDCLPPEEQPEPREEPRCQGRGCGASDGDPHLVTFDGMRYSFQAVGEFVAAIDPAGGFQVQVRQEPVPGSRVVSVNTAVAFDVAGDRVEVRRSGSGLLVLVDGVAVDGVDARLPAGGVVRQSDTHSARTATVSWPDGSTASVTSIGPFGLRLWVQPAEPRAGALSGLLGDFNGDFTDDLRLRSGDPLPPIPKFDDLYPAFADSWRVDAATSLFTYRPGEGPDTYTDRTFPDRPAGAADLPNREWAEEICRRTGVREGTALDNCTVDVALTGRIEFAASARETARFLDVYRPEGPGQLLRIDRPGTEAELTFEATAGEKVFIDVGWTSLPDQCGALTLLTPDGATLESGCLIDGRGHLDARELPEDGRYTVRIGSSGTGEARVWVVRVRDQHGEVTVDGPPVTAVIDHPGAVSRFTFTGRAGQRIFVDAPMSTAPAQCAPLTVRDPDNLLLGNGCLIAGQGMVNTVTLPVDGVYTVVVDLVDRTTGTTTLRVVDAGGVEGAVTVDGPPVTAVLDRLGAEARYTFDGVAGQRVAVEVSATTLPDHCAPLQLLGPDGLPVSLGCVLGGRGGIAPVTLPATGVYTVLVDPSGRAVGQVTLRVVTPA